MSDYQGNIIIKNPAVPTGPSTFGRAPGMWKLSDVAYWIKQGVWPNPAIVPDPQFPYVSLLLSTTALGNANNSLFVDSSGAFNVINRNGNTTQGSFTPYSTNWSNYFDGSGDYFTVPYTTANFDWWTSGVDFTIEAWVFATNLSTWQYTDSAAGVNSVMVGNAAATSEVNYWSFGPLANGTVRFKYYNGANNFVTSTATITANTWNHVAMTKTSSGITVYVNGVAGTTTAISGTPQSSTGYPLIVGQINNATASGYISNLRVVRGTAIYSGNFTPPTAPLTAVTNTTLLTCQSNRFRDASTNNLTLTVTGNTSVQDFSPFSPAYPGASYNQSDITNWSGYFDGSGDYLTVPDNPAFSYGTGDFTIECWVYASGLGATRRLYYHITTSTTQVTIYQLNTNYVGFYASNAGTPIIDILSNTLLPANAWTHIAVARNGNTFTLYQNGVSVATGTSASSMPDPTGAVNIGALDNGGEAWLGYISNLRVVKGTAVYTGAFTPPTTNLTAISGTSLLTLQNAAFTDNSTNNFVITPNGNTTVTGNSPFNTVGYWSNYFDGSGDYLSLASNDAFRVDQGDWTIEAWVFLNTTATNQTFINRGIFVNSYSFYFGTSGTSLYYEAGTGGWSTSATYTSSAGALSANQWIHIAAVRSGTSFFMYANGTRVLNQASASFGANTNTPIWIGSYLNGGATLDGYMSNLRFVKGTALYTGATYTVPTAPLTAIANTSLLTCQNGRFIDNSSNNFTLTVNGNPSVQSFDPFYSSTIASNSGSLYLDGNSDYLTSPTNVSYNFGGNNFTIEGWFYFTNSTANALQTLYSNYTSFSPAGSIFFGKHTNNSGYMTVWFSSYSTGGPLLVEGTYPPNNAWTHYALVRNGNTFTLYRNGVATTSATWAGAATAGACPAFIGAAGDAVTAYNFPGYISDFRITKSAVYTSAFTPPTAPLTPSANTTLLVNGMNAGVYDATTINDMETVGNTQVRYPWPFAPANYWAGWFDGNGDYLSYPEQVGDLGTADWTLECWAYPTATPPNYASLLNKNWTFSLQTGDFQWSIKHDDGFMSFAYVGGGGGITNITSTLAPALNTWTHYVVTRSGTTLRIYANGVLNTTATLPAGLSFGTASTIPVFTGYNSRDNCYYTGYISNLRVVAGTALYTGSTYTVPTTPLTAITNTSLLTCQNKTFIDNSSNAFTITSFGNAAAGAIGPFTATGGTSTYFDGSGDNLFMPSSPSMNCGTGNWTVEGWVCTLTRTTNYPLIFGNNRGGFTTDALAITASNSDSASFNDKFVVAWGSGGWSSPSAGNSALLVSNVTNSNGVWYHLAVVRNGTSVKMYRNGIEVASATVSSGATFNWGFNGSLSGGGNWDGAQGNWNGYLDELRVTNGVARYTANFTPPTQPFPIY